MPIALNSEGFDSIASRALSPSPLGFCKSMSRLPSSLHSRAAFRLFLCFAQFGLRASRGNEGCRIIRSKMKTKLKLVAVALMTGVALVGLSSCQKQQESALKPIDKTALQTMVDTTAKELRSRVLNLSIISRL